VIGAFTAVATTHHVLDGCRLSPAALLPLPTAVLCHLGHSFDAQVSGPVGVAVPLLLEGRVVVDVVLASHAVEVSDLIRRGRVTTVSMVIHGCEWGQLAGRPDLDRATLVAVDLVEPGGRPRNPDALIERVRYVHSLTNGQRRCREAFDRYLAEGGPCQIDFGAAVTRQGVAAFEPLAPIVASLQEELAPRRRAENRRQLQAVLHRSDRPRQAALL
jgi:hypothetical protein